MGDELGDDGAGRRTRADDYSSARIGAAAALTIVALAVWCRHARIVGFLRLSIPWPCRRSTAGE
jgi:hypothetical protein